MESDVKQPVFRSPVVLLIDDQPLVAHRVKSYLKNETDIVFHYCQDPAAAIAQAVNIQPTVILLDLVMPKIDGLTLCRLMRDTQEIADIPIVMLSANDDGQTKAHSFSSGANDYLVKLPEQVEFVARIRYHSKSYIIKLERDDAYEALCQAQLALESANFRLQRMAHQDELTQLPNRPLFTDRLAMTLAKAKRDHSYAAILYLDLDNFKPINDLYGHQAGDEALKIVARRLSGCVREIDTVARLGGDEFAIVLGELENKKHAAIVAQKIIHAIAEPLLLSGNKQSILGISIGISVFPDDCRELDGLVAYADYAMYQSKHQGKNCYNFFEDTQADCHVEQSWLSLHEDQCYGISTIDEQHTQLMQALSRLDLAIHSDVELEMIVSLFEQLLDEIKQHFTAEEQLLEHYQFPDYAAHQTEHANVLTKLKEAARYLDEPGGEFLILQDIKTCLLAHIKHDDQIASAYLKQQGVV